MRRTALHLLAILALGLGAAGCASTDTDGTGNSDMPWNAPQSWEGSPSIPGMSAPGY